MTREEALRKFDEVFMSEVAVKFSNPKCGLFPMIRASLKKQIPKKPVRSEEYVTGRLCPVCGKRLSIGYMTFCCDCGQALDWGDE